MSINQNTLASDPSPYLQQHKDNPVNWQVWSKNILETAKKNKKPILLSIGYASCHWCHVMACLLYTSPSPRDRQKSRMPSSA